MGFESIDDTETVEFIGETPAGNVKSHITFSVIGTVGLTLTVYEGPTTIAGGTPVTPVNMNRSSSNTSGVTALKDPTSIGADGDLIFAASVGADKEAGTIPSGPGFVLAPGTKYLYRITSLGDSNVISYRAVWAEIKQWQPAP
jgi:hypothetical protein